MKKKKKSKEQGAVGNSHGSTCKCESKSGYHSPASSSEYCVQEAVASEQDEVVSMECCPFGPILLHFSV